MSICCLPLVTLLVTSAALTASAVLPQDTEFIRALERAQRARPVEPQPTARIAPPSEPGTPLVIHGRVLADRGETPLANAIVFAYHTDREGLYDRPGSPPHSWRLRGWARTGPDGRFEFHTIRPGEYPGANAPPAHVHFTLFTPEGRYHAGELQFEGDRGIRREGNVEHVEVTLRRDPAQKF